MKTNSPFRTLMLLFVVSGVTLGANSLIHAQSVASKFREGDKVEVDSLQASTPDRAVWRTGTILKLISVSSLM